MEITMIAAVFAVIGVGGFIAALAIDASRGWAAEARRLARSNAEQRSLRYTVEALRAEIVSLRRTASRLIGDRAMLGKRLASANAGRKAAQRRVKALAQQRAELRAIVRELGAELAAAEEARAEEARFHDLYEALYQSASEGETALQARLRGALADAEGAAAEVAALRKQLAAADNANRQLRKELEAATQGVIAMRNIALEAIDQRDSAQIELLNEVLIGDRTHNF